MASPIAAIPRPRPGFLPPLAERWSEACAKLDKLDPGNATCRQMMSELALDKLHDQIALHSRPAPPNDPAMTAASHEHTELERRYHSAWLSCRDYQSRLRRSADSDIHRILADVPANAFDDVGPAIDMSVRGPRYSTLREARFAISELLQKVLHIEGRAAQLSAALSVGGEHDEQLTRRLVMRLFERLQDLEQQFAQLSAKQQRKVK